jgi:phage repressor protein C with HTH and peptisase S24 domain
MLQGMDAVRKLIRERLDELGMSMKEASLKIGMSHAYLQQFLKRGVPFRLPEAQRAELAALLGVPENELRGNSPKLSKREYSRNTEKQIFEDGRVKVSESGHQRMDKLSHFSPIYGERDDLPVFGTAQGGAGGALIMSNEAVDWAIRPAPLLRVRDGYGMIVTGDSMSPKIENGSTALINPHLPPRNGDTCVFRKRAEDGTVHVIVTLLRRFTEDTWFVHQLTPAKDFNLKRSEWQICHVVVGTYFYR